MESRFFDPELERASPETIRALQFQRLKTLLEKACSVNAFYREFWSAAGVDLNAIKSLEDFTARIPTVEKRHFIEDQQEHPPYGRRLEHALSLGVPLIICNTSGTSGQGQEVHAQTTEEFETTQRVYAFGLRWAGLKRGDTVFLTMPITMTSGGRCEYHGALGAGLTVSAVGNYDVRQKLELLRRFRPAALFGTTSYFAHLAAVSEEQPPSPGIRALLAGGEHAGFAWFRRLEAAWDAPVFDRYGSTQSGNDHAFACEHGIGTRERPGTVHNIDPYHIAEVIDPLTGRQVRHGEEGEIVFTSLYRTDTPAVRIRLRDRAIWHEPGACRCGRPFTGLEMCSIVRVDDMKKVKGVNIWPQAVDDAMFALDEVDEYQVVLTSDPTEADVATVKLMPKVDVRRKDLLQRVASNLRERTGIHFQVELVAPGSLQHSEYKARRWIDERHR